MYCISCGMDDMEVIDEKYLKSTNTIVRTRKCHYCGREYITYEMISDKMDSAYEEIQHWKRQDRIDRRIIVNSRKDLYDVIKKLEKATKVLDSIPAEDIVEEII